MLCKHQTSLCLGTAGLLVLGFSIARNDSGLSDSWDQLQSERFWLLKARNTQVYDLVILGDSRAYRGLSPVEMQKTLKSWRVYNFGFSAGGLNPEMYQAAEKLLDPCSKCKSMLLVISPGTLMGATENNRQFREEHGRPSSAYVERVFINSHLTRFLPVDWRSFLCRLTGHGNSTVHINRYKDDGWVGSNMSPEDPSEQLEPFRLVMQKYTVKPSLVRAALTKTELWRSSGIRVFGLRPPVSPAMKELEDKMSGFDEQMFSRDFCAAGGTWIAVNSDEYHTYDGSHLAEDSALKLSAHIASCIAKYGSNESR